MDNEKRARFLSSNDNNDPKIGKVKFLELRLQSHQNVNSTIFTFIIVFFFLVSFLGHDQTGPLYSVRLTIANTIFFVSRT